MATANGAYGRIERFEYPAGPGSPPMPEWDGWVYAEDGAPKAVDTAVRDPKTAAIEARLSTEFDARLAEETRRSFDAGHAKGRQAEHEAQAAGAIAAEKQRVQQATNLIAGFTEERNRYLQAVEHEVVKLALAVAARILRREAQMDPLLLTGAVRVALGQLAGSTQIKLRVPPAELGLWTEAIAHLPNLAVKPTVSAGDGMRLGDCVLETELGSVDLGIRAQLSEIERGFFDRAGAAAPTAANAASSDAQPESRP